MADFYFTFGQSHAHRVNNFTWDCHVVCLIRAKNGDIARELMHGAFGPKWAFQYDSLEAVHLEYYRRGVQALNEREDFSMTDEQRRYEQWKADTDAELSYGQFIQKCTDSDTDPMDVIGEKGEEGGF